MTSSKVLESLPKGRATRKVAKVVFLEERFFKTSRQISLAACSSFRDMRREFCL